MEKKENRRAVYKRADGKGLYNFRCYLFGFTVVYNQTVAIIETTNGRIKQVPLDAIVLDDLGEIKCEDDIYLGESFGDCARTID